MAIDVNTICDDVQCMCGAPIHQDTFRYYVLQLLCAIAGATTTATAARTEEQTSTAQQGRTEKRL